MISEASSLHSRRPSPRHPLGPSPHGRFKGVRMCSWGRWVSEIRVPHSRDKIWLGSYSLPELAARAYDTAYLLLHGPSASSSLNLSDSSHLITPHLSAYANGHHAITRRTIQTVAAEIANAIAGVDTPLQLGPAAEEQGTATTSQLDAQSGEESCRERLSQNSMEEQLVSMEPRWIHDVSPREKMSSSFFVPASANRQQGAGSGAVSCSTSLDQQQVMSAGSLVVGDEFQYQALQEWLAQDGFTPISPAVTTRADIAPPSDARLWRTDISYY